eukprot:65479-Pyramimonas_sp.AAC.1
MFVSRPTRRGDVCVTAGATDQACGMCAGAAPSAAPRHRRDVCVTPDATGKRGYVLTRDQSDAGAGPGAELHHDGGGVHPRGGDRAARARAAHVRHLLCRQAAAPAGRPLHDAGEGDVAAPPAGGRPADPPGQLINRGWLSG